MSKFPYVICLYSILLFATDHPALADSASYPLTIPDRATGAGSFEFALRGKTVNLEEDEPSSSYDVGLGYFWVNGFVTGFSLGFDDGPNTQTTGAGLWTEYHMAPRYFFGPFLGAGVYNLKRKDQDSFDTFNLYLGLNTFLTRNVAIVTSFNSQSEINVEDSATNFIRVGLAYYFTTSRHELVTAPAQ